MTGLTRSLLAGSLLGGALLGSSHAPRLPLFFVEIAGPGASGVRFVTRGSGVTASFSPQAVMYRTRTGTVGMSFPGSNPRPVLTGEGEQPGKANFLVGAEADWLVDLRTWRALVYRELYPGVDMRYDGLGRALKSEFVVRPGARPSAIRIRYQGAGRPVVRTDGSLAIPIAGEELREEAPTAYQDIGGARRAVDAAFEILPGGEVGFRLGPYDHAAPLVIDPVLAYSTLVGGRGLDTVFAVAADASGNAYLAGKTDSYDLPVVNGAQSGSAGGTEAFVAKLNAGGNGLAFCTYIGGARDDRAFGIAIDSTGAAYITGATYSQNFPVRNAVQPRIPGMRSAFVLKLSPAGNAIAFSTYLGGSANDAGNAIAIDNSGYVYVAGDATSTNFPATGYQRSNRGLQDGFVTKFSQDGRTVLYSTLLGGSAEDHVAAIAVDAAGIVTVAGSTFSTDFPASAGQRTLGGRQDGFVARLNASATGLLYATYLGGGAGGVGFPEEARAVAVDGAGNAYVAGVTSSSNFPLVRPAQSALRGMTDAFAAILSPAGALAYASFLGGSGWDSANAIGIDAGGGIFVAGETTSADFPVVSAAQGLNAGDYDAFVVRLSPGGNAVQYASYLGGNGADTALALALDPGGNVFIAGQTQSTNLPIVNGFQASNPGNFGGFAAKFTFASYPVPAGVSPAGGSGTSQVFRLRIGNETGAAAIETASLLLNTSATAVNGCAVVYNRPLHTLAVLTDAGTLPANAVVPGSGGTSENSQCTLAAGGSSVALDGNVLTLDVQLAFKPSFSGPKNVYVRGTNQSGSSGWQSMGTWSVVAAAGGLRFVPVTPCRVADTRPGGGFTGAYGPPFMAAGSIRSYSVPASVCNIPADAAAYSLNITVVPRGPLGSLTVWPAGYPQPAVSTLNSPAGIVVANAAIVAAGIGGAISFFAGNDTNVLFDINGYFSPTASAGLQFFPIAPCRIADTRAGGGKGGAYGPPVLSGEEIRSYGIPGSGCGVPATAAAYSFNFTVVPHGPLGYLSAWPAGQSRPGVSVMNSPLGSVVANAAIVPAGSGGAISLFASNTTDALFDVNGYLAPPGPGGLNFYPVAACRVLDTRSSGGLTGAFGPPMIPGGGARTIPVGASGCGIPSTAAAYSLNITILPPAPVGYLSVWPSGLARPGVSTLNSYTGSTVANAALVPAGTGGSVDVFVSHATDVLLDVNGYFAP